MHHRVDLKTVTPPRERRPVRKKKRTYPIFKGLLVVIGAILLTTFVIHASDKFTNPDASLLAGVAGSSGAPAHCPSDMVYVPNARGGYCIDRYENSAGSECRITDPKNQFDTEQNLGNIACLPVSKKDALPWVNIPEHQAQLLCARAGKRLPTNREWYDAALGTPDELSDDPDTCAIGKTGQSGADRTGEHEKCISSCGAYDMVGNVWEWVDASVRDGVYEGNALPDDGFVSEVDSDGVPTHTSTTSVSMFGGDYFFIDKTDAKGMFRGGFWSLKERGGIYTINATISTSFVGNAAGFRCVKDSR